MNMNMQTLSAQEVVQSYLDAFTARDLARCLEHFSGDAKVEFVTATYQGKGPLEEWHTARFGANAQVVRIDDIKTDGDIVTINGVVTSKRLKAWRITNLSGKAIFQVRDGKIAGVKFGLRNYNPAEAFRSK